MLTIENWNYENIKSELKDLTREQKIEVAIFSAKKVIHIFETEYPNDKRPRLAIEAAESYLADPNEENKLKVNAAYAAYAANTYAAYAGVAAYTAANAAATTAYNAAYAENVKLEIIAYINKLKTTQTTKNNSEKLITTPLPTKELAPTATKEEEFEMSQIEKNNGDNLMFAGESSDKSKEWPQVCDEVLICDEESLGRLSDLAGLTCTTIGICKDGHGVKILTLECSDLGVYAIADGPWIKKPKTPDKELLDELVSVWNSEPGRESIIEALISNYNITKKPQ